MNVLVTGAAGSIGQALLERLDGHNVLATDQGTLDVTSRTECMIRVSEHRPDVIFHLAGAKHAPEGEEDPLHVAAVNVTGTANVLHAAEHVGARVVAASTCKACDPETVYGATKLIAERMVLNAGQVVVRYYNVRETSGNVFRLWEQIPFPDPIPFTNCRRYFISLERAVTLTLAGASLPPGRYTVQPDGPFHMRNVAERLYPGRDLVRIPRRRGDRFEEPLCADAERVTPYGPFVRIVGEHDPVVELGEAA